MKTQEQLVVLSLSLAFLLMSLASSCSGPRGRIMGENEKDYVDVGGAGAPTWDRLIEASVEKLLDRHRNDFSNRKVRRVAFIDVENRSGEELGEWREQIFDLVDTKINHFPGYTLISERMVNVALRELRLEPEKLFLPKHRRAFTALLEKQKNPAEFLFFVSITRGQTHAGGGVRQANYALKVELINADDGSKDAEIARVRKAFTK